MTRTQYIYIACILMAAACSSDRREATAHVIQRRYKTEGKLVISYRFHTGEKWIYDSAEIDNTIIPHDSLTVFFSPEHPERNSLRIP